MHIVIQHHTIYFVAQIVPTFATGGFFRLTEMTLSFWIVEHFLCFLELTNASGSSCIFCAPPRIRLFLQGDLVTFTGEWYFKIQIWTLGRSCFVFGVKPTSPLTNTIRNNLLVMVKENYLF